VLLDQVFGAEVLMLFNAGSGEMIKAALVQQIYAVAICANNAHKNVVLENLMAFVKLKGMVNLATDAPTKPADLVAFEKQLLVDARTGQASVGGPPGPPAGTGQASVGGGGSNPPNDAGTAPAAEGNAGADTSVDDLVWPGGRQGVVPKPGAQGKKNLFAFGNMSF